MSKNVDYHNFKFIEKVGKYHDYADCLLQASKNIGVKNARVYYNDEDPGYEGAEDLHLEGVFEGRKIYFYLRQYYGSCSYCDWLQNAGEDEVIQEYEKQLRNSFYI